MNVNQSRLLSFLSKAVKGEAEMPPHILDEFADNCRQALNKQFNEQRGDFRLRMSNVGKPLCQLQIGNPLPFLGMGEAQLYFQ